MKASRLSSARTIWRARRERTCGDNAYALYAFMLVATIAFVPIVRALWIVANSPSGLAVLMSANASGAVSFLVATLWVGGLLVGRMRGPALLPPFLLHALTGSGIRRSAALRGSVIRSAAVITAVCVAGALFVSMILFSHGQMQFGGLVTFVAAATGTGVVTTVMWLIGQVFPRFAFPLALIALVLAGMSLSMPSLLAFLPWGWAGATYLSAEPDLLPLAAIAVLATSSVFMTPALLDRLTGMQLGAQAARWERARAFSFSFDFRAATAVYEAAPRLGRSLRAITPNKRRWVTFFVRDAIGQARTPGRSLSAVTETAIAGALMTLSFLPGTPSEILAGTAGVVLYGAAGPFTKGLQHAASVAGDYPLYGISDRHLVFLHALFPLAALLPVLSIAATATALAIGATLGLALTGACAVGVLTLTIRVSSALKGPLPPSLLTPVNTPAGDLSIVMRVGWAFSDPLTSSFGALTVTVLPVTPIPLVLMALWCTGVTLIRWRKRR